MLKRYVLFNMDHYYPDGGMDDMVNDYDDLSEAIAYSMGLESTNGCGCHISIYDIIDKEIVYSREEDK